MTTYAELQAGAEAALRRLAAQDRPRLAVAIDTSSLALGADEVLATLQAAVAEGGLDIDVGRVGGNGLSFANPTVEYITPNGDRIMYEKVFPEQARDFLAAIQRGDLNNRWLLGAVEGAENMEQLAEHGWWPIQERRLMQDMGIVDPESIDDAIARGTYGGLERALGMTDEEVIAEVSGSKLLGRSGSFFPTGRKWDFLRTSRTTPKAIVCNADEGDPGAWVNRMTMENDPHSLVEGMIIAGWATGARHGYIYIREEYPLAFARVQLAVDQARERGILGDSVLGRNFSYDIKVVRGAGSYVCGEETGLIASIEDSRGMPKVKPPFPAAAGVFGEGSNVNNVQSYHYAAWILRNGVETYANVGTERNPGTMMFTLSGHVQRVGCFEVPFGTSVREVFEICGGGPPEGHDFKALQPGGPLLGVLPEWSRDLTIEPESFREKGAIGLGGGGFVFLDDTACIVELCTQYEWFIEDESCGRCTTCHGGTQRAVEVLRRIQRGGGRESDIGKLRLLGETLRYSNCFHGQFALAIVTNMLDWFTDELEEHIFDRHCRAGQCKELLNYDVDRAALEKPENAGALARAKELCLEVVTGKATEPCLECVVCRDLLPDAIKVTSRFERGIGPAPELISVQPASR